VSQFTHLRDENGIWTLCGILEAPHYVEGGESAVAFFRSLIVTGRACPICRRRLEDPGRRIEFPDFEFKTTCTYCEEADNLSDDVTILVKVALTPHNEEDCIVWMRCSRCECGKPCSEDVALDAWKEEVIREAAELQAAMTEERISYERRRAHP
jgi:hypothetical protein